MTIERTAEQIPSGSLLFNLDQHPIVPGSLLRTAKGGSLRDRSLVGDKFSVQQRIIYRWNKVKL